MPAAGTWCSLAPGGSAEVTVTPVAPWQGCWAMGEAVHGPTLLQLGSSHEQREAQQEMAGPWGEDEGDVGSQLCPRDSVGWAGVTAPVMCWRSAG